MSKDEFEQMLNETNDLVNILGMNWEAGSLLRKVDPVSFTEMYWMHVHSMDWHSMEEVEEV